MMVIIFLPRDHRKRAAGDAGSIASALASPIAGASAPSRKPRTLAGALPIPDADMP